MSEDNELARSNVSVPEQHYGDWLNIQTEIATRKIRYGFAEKSLPYGTAIIIFVLTAILCPLALIMVIPALIAFLKEAVRNK